MPNQSIKSTRSGRPTAQSLRSFASAYQQRWASIMKMVLALSLILCASNSYASPAVMDGLWKIEWPCDMDGAVGIDPERCRGGSDIFILDLWSSGQELCGYYLATVGLGNKVDESEETPSIKGRKHGGSATVAFVNGDGVKGVASIKVVGNTLHWKILSQEAGPSLLPSQAVLQRQDTASPRGTHDTCSN